MPAASSETGHCRRPTPSKKLPKANLYKLLIDQEIKSWLDSETNFIANMANLASLLFTALNSRLEQSDLLYQNVNWFGFYLCDFVNKSNSHIVLGPFAGKPACTRIAVDGGGVCAACASSQKTLVVPDVHEFPGHIACDSASNSEICVPLFRTDSNTGERKFVGLIDVDSPNLNNFDDADREFLEQVALLLEKHTDWSAFEF